MAHADSARGREALAAVDFYVHADLFMNPTAKLADIVLPVASAFETEALKIGFEVSAEAQLLVQVRRPVVAPRGEARSDTQIVFELARRVASPRRRERSSCIPRPSRGTAIRRLPTMRSRWSARSRGRIWPSASHSS